LSNAQLGNKTQQQQAESEEIGEALLFLAKYEMDRFRYREATEYAKIAADFPYPVSGRSRFRKMIAIF
jgi:hypothetical protein